MTPSQGIKDRSCNSSYSLVRGLDHGFCEEHLLETQRMVFEDGGVLP